MGTWATSVFSDDLAADLRDEFRDLIGDGMTSSEAVEKLLQRYPTSVQDPDERCVFWIALAVSQWKLGRLEERTKNEALRIIDSGEDLKRFDRPSDRKKRALVLEKVRQELGSEQPAQKHVARTIKEANTWSIGEVIAFRLSSGHSTLLRTIGHYSDRGGTFAVCELLDWQGNNLPSAEVIATLPVRVGNERTTQFMFQEPQSARDRTRITRLGIVTPPSQRVAGFTAVVWKHVDDTLRRLFGIE